MTSRQSESLQAYNASAWGSIAISTDDTAVISPVLRGLYVGAAGNVKVRMLDGSTPTFIAVAAGSVLPIQIDMVFTTGTTGQVAGSMIGLI